jgi:hypothetical protein
MLEVDYRDHPSPGSVESTINELNRWRKNRIKKDLECGALDRAVLNLEKYRNFLITLYKETMRVEAMTMRTRALVHAENPDPDATDELPCLPDEDES